MKNQLIKIEIKAVLLIITLLIIGIFLKVNFLLLVFVSVLFSCFAICDYREYQESQEYVDTLYKQQ
ncbi:MAG: hypothetical protein KAR81_07135 [Sulfurimonas sp.]|nr:hypothetical protein [Sulfurimonas sp.]